MNPNHHRETLTRWQRRLGQDLRVLRKLFPWRVGLALVAGIAATAYVFQQAYLSAYNLVATEFSYIKAVYAILNMATFQVSFSDIPHGPKLDLFFILVPVVGIPLLLIFGANLLHVVRVFFVRRERGQAWQRALATTVASPIVVCGLGRVGYRVAGELLDMRRPVVGLDKADSPLIQSLMDRGLPVILGDVRNQDVLIGAGVKRAPTVIVCTHDDLANIEAAFHVHRLNKDAHIVLRLFEDEIADDIRGRFQVETILSRSAIAAQAFAHAALGVAVLESFQVDGATYVLAEVPISSASPLRSQSLGTIARANQATIVCLYRDGRLLLEPAPDTILDTGDELFLFTDVERLALLSDTVRPSAGAAQQEKPVLVCGLGHTGYRVVKALRTLGRPVVALDFEPGRLAERLEEMQVDVFYGDFRRTTILEEAGIRSAEAIILCTEDGMANFETALRARESAPGVRVIMRIFEEPLGTQLQQAFDIDAVYSTSALAAPAFVAAALKIHLTQSVTLGDQVYLIARMTIETLSDLSRQPIDRLNQQNDLTVLLHKRGNEVLIPPDSRVYLRAEDEIVILATRQRLREIDLRNRGNWNP